MVWKKDRIVEESTNASFLKGKKLARKVMAFVLAATMLVGGVFTAQAATMKDLFDAKAYSARYSDLSAAFGTNEKALYKHYITHGMAENRTMNELIDVKKYRAAYADLDAAFGDNWDAYVNHYITFGAREGRNAFGTFDALAYASRYPDLQAAYGNNVLALYQHYVRFGRNEGRIGTADGYVANAASGASSAASDDDDDDDNHATVTPAPTATPAPTTAPSDPEGPPVEVTGVMCDPETGAPIPNATIHFTPVGTAREAILAAITNVAATAANQSVATAATTDVTGGDVTGGNVTGGDVQPTAAPTTQPTVPPTTQPIVYEAVTDANGNFVVYLPAGTYRAEVTAAGYLALTIDNIVVNDGEAASVPTVQLLSESADGESRIAGHLTNAIDGSAIANATVELRSGWGNYTGEVVATTTTDANGDYEIGVDRGYYTATYSAAGFITKSMNVISATNYTTNIQHEAMTPSGLAADSYRIVLTWGENPRDLDSHITGPAADGTRFHVAYYNREYSVNGEAVVTLDHDDVTSFGPETVTVITPEDNAIYRYSVHHFSGTGSLTTSNAEVNVYAGSNLIATYNVPVTGEGRIWNVFEIRDGQFVVLNNLVDGSSSGDAYYADADYTE